MTRRLEKHIMQNAEGKTSPVRRKRRSSEEIMDRLIVAAREEFERSGYAGATTAAIARRADITEAQLFRYFPSKDALFRDAIFKPLDQHFEAFNRRQLAANDPDGDIRDQTRRYITELQNFIGEHAQMLMSLAVAQAYAQGSTEGVDGIDSLRAYFDLGAATRSSRAGQTPRINPQLLVRVSFAAVLASVMFKDWLFPQGLASEEEIRTAVIDFVLDGIGANDDPATHTPDN